MRKVLTAVVVILVVVTVVIAIGNAVSNSLDTEKITVNTGKSTGFTAVIIGDMHYPYNRVSLDEILSASKNADADFIFLTGDILDGEAKENDVSALAAFLKKLCALAPCFGVIGNHEIGSDYLYDYLAAAESAGVIMLLNKTVTVGLRDTNISITGLSDGYPYTESTTGISAVPSSYCKVLLSHRPEKFEEYVEDETLRPDVIFCGHAHGGAARLGKLALYAPNQGLFPKYTSGAYEKNGATMIVTRGLGANADFRVFNRYHIPIVTIK
jgi:predicted MPP superfamily phosphohydrolase